MKTVREGVFETNSSSTHTLTMCKKSEYEKFENGELLFNWDHEELDTMEEAYNSMKEYYGADGSSFTLVDPYKLDFENSLTLEKFKSIIESKESLYRYSEDENGNEIQYDNTDKIHSDWEAVSYFCRWKYRKESEWPDWAEDSFCGSCTTDSGETIIAFGWFGHD